MSAFKWGKKTFSHFNVIIYLHQCEWVEIEEERQTQQASGENDAPSALKFQLPTKKTATQSSHGSDRFICKKNFTPFIKFPCQHKKKHNYNLIETHFF